LKKTFCVNERSLASNLLSMLKEKPTNEYSYNFGSVKPPLSIIPRTTDLLDMDPTEVARQLCLYEQHLFKRIHPKELLHQAWNKPDRLESAPSICAMIDHFNRVGTWVISEIVTQQNINNRVNIVKRLLKVAIKCREQNNFNCCQEIIAGFGSAAVHRLHKTWARIQKNEPKLIAQFNDIREIMSNSKSFHKYRNELNNVNPPCLPYLGVFLTDLTFIEDGNRDYLITTDGRTDIINFEKMRKVATVIEKIRIYQPVPYNFEKVPVIYDFIQHNLPHIEDTNAFELSRQIEPKEDVKK